MGNGTYEKDPCGNPGDDASSTFLTKASPRSEEKKEEKETEMTTPELEAIVSDLTSNPLDEDNEKWMYAIEKFSDREVRVTRLLHSHKIARKLESQIDKMERKRNRKKNNQRTSGDQLTQIGSDPLPPEGPSAGIKMKEGRRPEEKGFDVSNNKTQVHEEAAHADPLKLRNTQDKKEELDGIKEEEMTGQVKRAPTLLSPAQPPFETPELISNPPANTPHPSKILKQNSTNCPRQMPQQNPQNPPPPVLRSFAAVSIPRAPLHLHPHTMHSAPSEGPIRGIGPCPQQHRPGLIAATHLAEVEPRTLGLPSHSFVGYGATIVSEGPNGSIQTHHGHIQVNLYVPHGQNYGNGPPPPLLGRIQAAHRELLRPEVIMDYREDSPFGPNHRTRQRERFPFLDEAPNANPSTGGGPTISNGKEDNQNADTIEAAKTLVSL